MKVDSGLASCTTELEFGYLGGIDGYPSLKDRRIVLVDTPGFNDRSVEDFEISEKISAWLRESYVGGRNYTDRWTNRGVIIVVRRDRNLAVSFTFMK